MRANPTIRRRARELRQPLTPAETALWALLRSRPIRGAKWRRQHPVGAFIVDFYCAEQRLIVELDGAVHATQLERDLERSLWLAEQGYRVLRFGNDAVAHELAAVLERIEAAFR